MGTHGLKLGISDVSVHFGGLHALDGVDLVVKPGTIAGLIGPNGAGKTTLFNVISGFVKPRSGTVTLDDTDITTRSAPTRAGLGLVRTFQQVGLVRDVTVRANAVMAQHRMMRSGVVAGLFGAAGAEERELVERADDALASLDLDVYSGKRVRDLPHGVHKLVELACAIVREPRVLLLDEPSAGLDPSETAELADRLHALQSAHGFTALVIDHDMRAVRRLADEITVLSFGRVLARGTWDEIRSDPDVIAAYLGPSKEVRRGRPRAR